MLRLWLSFGVGLSWWSLGERLAIAQEPGKYIVVVGEAPLKVRDEVVGTLYPGTILKVTQANGKWLALEGQRGWFDETHVRGVEEAIKLYQERAISNPSDLSALSTLGSLYYHEEVYPASIDAYNQALRLDPKRPQLFNNRGLTLSAQGRYELAEKDFQKAIQLAPKYAQAYANLGWLYFLTDKMAEAIQQYNKAIELEKDNASHYINRAGCFRELGRVDEAMRDFVRAVELSGNVPDAYVGQSTILMDKLDFAGAIAAADQALKLDKSRLGQSLNGQNRSSPWRFEPSRHIRTRLLVGSAQSFGGVAGIETFPRGRVGSHAGAIIGRGTSRSLVESGRTALAPTPIRRSPSRVSKEPRTGAGTGRDPKRSRLVLRNLSRR
jgi:tetratricopeptide (TPR) repeat protein